MSEFNAALGLLQLKHIGDALAKRKQLDNAYRARLEGVKGIKCLKGGVEDDSNFAYFPILVQPDFPMRRDDLYQQLKDRGIHPRRYFYPLISDFPMYRSLPSATKENLPVATSSAQQVLCLPFYPDLQLSVVDEITHFISDQWR